MKKNLVLIFIFFIVFISITYFQSGVKNNSISEASHVSYTLDWLIGNWVRKNNSVGKETFENWVKISNNEYHGRGYTIKKNIRIFEEVIKLKRINGNWNLEVSGVNEKPTIFQFTEQSKLGFVCENEKNKFPKKIEYWIDGEMLKAKISDSNTRILFLFEKLSSK